MPPARSLLKRFARDESGVFAVIFGLMAIVLVALGGAVVDYVTLEQTRARAQTALDAAVLALHDEIFTGATDEFIRSRAEEIVLERIGDTRISAELEPVEIDRETGRLLLRGRFSMPTQFVGLVGVNSLGAAFTSEAVRGSVNLEVALALDVTGSMEEDDMEVLRDSVSELIDTIVQDSQDPVYSKMALIPYSQAVNAGTYAAAIRGPIRGPKTVNDISVFSTTTIRSISNVQVANNGTVTVSSSGHGYQNGEWVLIWGAENYSWWTGVTASELNGRAFQVTGRNNNSFQLRDENGRGFGSYLRNGSIRRCQLAECQVQVSSAAHGYAVGDWVHMTDVSGLTGVNNLTYRVATRTNNTLTLAGLAPAHGVGSYINNNSGRLHCTWQNAAEGCTYYRFQSAAGNWNTFPNTTCVTERAANGRTDLPPTTTKMGRNYASPSNGCLPNSMVPLSDNRTQLHAAVNALTAAGSTSGSLGVLWSWYMLAPNFGYIWPAGSQPAPYNTDELLKAAIIMTDGEFNTVHCEGVVARNSTSGSGSTSDHNRCNAPNGDPYFQAEAYCDAMEAAGIEVYTVGFNITSGSRAARLLDYCASASENFYLAQDGAQLRGVFRRIARNISSLRLSL